MNQTELKHYIHQMAQSVRQSGIIALNFQGKVENIGKNIDVMKNDTEQMKADRAAKTIIDNTVQDILLLTAADLFKDIAITIDAEEETSLAEIFKQTSDSLSLVIDPIDGTNNYLHNKPLFSICVGLLESGKVINSIVFFPKKDEFYFLDENQKPYLATNSLKQGLSNRLLLTNPHNSSRIVAYNNRVDSKIITTLKEAGIETVEENEMAAALLKCISGEFRAYIEDTPQIRDVLLGAIIENIDQGQALDWQGNKLIWPLSGRIPQALFGIGELDDIVKLINK